jgi:murein DD-endopeptidase MepM/ murein hydrolase activator NlpD
MKRILSIIIVPHDNAKTMNYRVSYRLIYTLLVLFALSLFVLILFVGNYGRVFVKAQSALRLERENRRLLARVAEVDSLKNELMQLQTLSLQIKRMLGLNLSPRDSVLVANLSTAVKSPAIGDDENLLQVDGEEQKKMLKAIPSIWPAQGYVTREFYTTGGEKSAKYHPGIDIAAKSGTPVMAGAEGVVVTSTWDETYGNMIVIDHGFGISTLYGHNARNLVKEGDRVTKGQVIAFLGSSGRSTAPHLHFEIRKNGLPINPRDYLLE